MIYLRELSVVLTWRESLRKLSLVNTHEMYALFTTTKTIEKQSA